MIGAVPRDKLAVVWPQCAELLRPSLELFSLCDAEEVRADIAAGRAHLWVQLDGAVVEAAVVSRVLKARGGDWLHVWLPGALPGRARWKEIQAKIETWMLTVGLKRAFFEGREGWVRELVGFRPVMALAVREL